MNRRGQILGAGLFVALVVCGVVTFNGRRETSPPEGGRIPEGTGRDRHVPQTITSAPRAVAGVLQQLAIGGHLSAIELTATLGRLRLQLLAMQSGDAALSLKGFLDIGVDSATGEQFIVGEGGTLVGAPTLRVWALDQLGLIDPILAASYARTIFLHSSSADEWAIALRHLWRGPAEGGRLVEIRARVLELLDRSGWADTPSRGFLEALDFTVCTLAWEAVPRFEQWLRPETPPALRRGAWVALERLTQAGPDDLLPLLTSRLDWLATQPMLRAGLLARADVRQPSQREAAESYLLNRTLSSREGTRFFELFPNLSGTVSHGLATSPRMISASESAARDRASLAVVRAWINNPAFARWRANLSQSETRLAQHVAAAEHGGF